ncbi:leucine-rich repeat protein [Aminipila sp.]|uniref:leucine-rich repeat protein n=1 Tax=Aminipila sp. TaxID=2060095 RepID=UPI00289A1A74|nr:leucine-rich repeat protein [Aminipila sp.]
MPISDDYIYTIVDNHATIIAYTGSGGKITIPATLGGCSVTGIEMYVFFRSYSLISVTIPDSVTSIGEGAFQSCINLNSVNIPDNVTVISNYMFADCISLSSVAIPDSVTSIGISAFNGCINLTSVNIPNGVTHLSDYVFLDCLRLTSVTIPDNVISIGIYAFFSCASLTNVTIPDSVTSIGEYAFYLCTSLTNVTIPDSVTHIGDSVFFLCTNLTSIDVNNGNSNYSSLDGVLYNKLQTTLICYPAGKTGSFNVPNSVSSINWAAFYSCTNLTSVTIPNSVINIGGIAFYGCINLLSAKYYGNAPTMGSDVFNNVSIDFTVYYLYEKTGFDTPIWQPDKTTNLYKAEPFYSVTYDGNGNTSGIAPSDSDTTIPVSYNTGSLKKVGYAFRGWNTKADGTGTHYDPGTAFGVVHQNVILYAQWKFSQLIISNTLITTVLT